MDRRTTIGFLLIMGLLYTYMLLNKPSEAELAEIQKRQDSLAQTEQETDFHSSITDTSSADKASNLSTNPVSDSLALLTLQTEFGDFAQLAIGKEEKHTLSNDLMTVTFNSKGGRIVDIELHEHYKIHETDDKEEKKLPLHLLNNDKDRFSYSIPMRGLDKEIHTEDLFFATTQKDNTIIFSAQNASGGIIRQVYSLAVSGYEIDYRVELENLDRTITDESITLEWDTYLGKLEKNDNYERRFSTVYYKETKDNMEHCNCSKSDQDKLLDKPIKWTSHANQFFNSTLIAEKSFSGGVFETEEVGKDAESLKFVSSRLQVPLEGSSSESFAMTMYIGPNEFNRLQDIGYGLYNIIPFGSNIFGSMNQWIIRPAFNLLNGIFNNKGLSIIVLTLLIKLAVYPLTYRSLRSASKMQALKPEMEKLKEKYKDDSQKVQMETMKLYQEFGVNPAGGCFPMLLQMPIWFAIFRFFPASIQFRQEPFLWATDLSSYDVFFRLPSEIPGFGGHISLFALLWAISSVIYSVYNMKNMNTAQMSDQMKPMMYMQYFMPVMFFFVFNNYASGLSCYFFFSNLINILQTLVTKNYILDNDKIRAELEKNKSKPKKKGGFQERLQKALAEQQKIAEERQKQQQGNKSKKKK